MAGDVLAEALTGHLYPEDLQARLRPFGIGEQVAVLAFRPPDPSAAAALVERMLERERVPSLVAIRAGLLCAVVDAGGRRARGLLAVELARTVRAELGDALRRASARPPAGPPRRTRCG